jgi:hypothetical protein
MATGHSQKQRKTTMNKILLLLGFVLVTPYAFAQSATDNEIMLNQSGDTLTLTIDQVGYGNKICGSLNSDICATDWTLTGSTLTINIDMIGNSNKIYGPTILDSSDIDLTFTGDSNVWDWNIGYIGSADSSNMLVDFTGDSNSIDLDWGYAASAERLDFDFDIIGDSNVFNIDLESDDITWDVDITGDSNNVVTDIKDGAYHSLTLDHTGSNADIDIFMQSGTCPTGVSSCKSVIDITSDSENATITINQKDTGDT